jgi:transcriptional regulator of heat shock response
MLGKLKFKTALAEGILDNGETNIFIGDSKFNVFMQSVEELFTTDETTAVTTPAGEAVEETMEKPVVEAEKTADTFANDDDVKRVQPAATKEKTAAIEQTSNLLQTASSFISQLTTVLNDSTATENLIQSLTRKDEATGQTYLQIPIENEAAVKNAFALIAGLFKGLR